MSVSILGVSFHLYGFIVAGSFLIAWEYAQSVFATEKKKSAARSVEVSLISVAVVLLLGARIWHVISDFHLYQDNWRGMLILSNGGLSILGALAGLMIFIAFKLTFGKLTFLQLRVLADGAGCSVPLALALGRWANYFNQELYGLPTTAPWAVFIAPEFRVAQYSEQQWFHPLFFYESVFCLFLFIFLKLLSQRAQFEVGSGRLALLFFYSYGSWRFFLDWLRIEHTNFFMQLSFNQTVLLVLMSLCAFSQLLYYLRERYTTLQ